MGMLLQMGKFISGQVLANGQVLAHGSWLMAEACPWPGPGPAPGTAGPPHWEPPRPAPQRRRGVHDPSTRNWITTPNVDEDDRSHDGLTISSHTTDTTTTNADQMPTT